MGVCDRQKVVLVRAGLLDLGYVAFFAVGGYTAAIMTSPSSPGLSPELPWWVAIFVVVFMAIVVAVMLMAIYLPMINIYGSANL